MFPSFEELPKLLAQVASEGPVVTAVANGKGGVGKTKTTGDFAQRSSWDGQRTEVLDLDTTPGQTVQFVVFNDNWMRAQGKIPEDIMGELDRAPMDKTVIRYILQPSDDPKEYAKYFPTGHVLEAVDTDLIKRPKGHTIDLATMKTQGFAYYGIDPARAVPICLLPNNGSTEELMQGIDDMKKANPRLKKYHIIANAIRQHVEHGHIGKRWRIFIDLPGDRGIESKLGYMAADIVLIPFEPTSLGQYGTQTTLTDVRKAIQDRGDPLGRPWPLIIPVKVTNTPLEQQFWQDAYAQLQETFARYGRVPISPITIPFSRSFVEAGQIGSLEIYFDLMDPANIAYDKLYRHLFGKGVA